MIKTMNEKIFDEDGVILTVKPRYQNAMNYDWTAQRYEEGSDELVTVPGQSLSIQEIIRRFANGLPLGGFRQPIFDEDDDTPDLRKLDLAEREEYKRHYQAELKDIHEKWAQANKPPLPPSPEPKNDDSGDSSPATPAPKPDSTNKP